MTTTLSGTFNFRDTGGMPLASGGATRPGILFRSDALSGLTPEGLEQLAASEIGVIVDFRTPMERQMAPDRLPTSRPLHVVELPLLEGAASGMAQQAAQAMAQGGDAAARAQAMEAALATIPALGDMYVEMLGHGATAFAQLARLVAAVEPGAHNAVLVHCTAGKDRTGVGTALVLDAVGADRDAIVADYASSQKRLAGPWRDGMFAMVQKLGIPLTDQIRDLISDTPPSAIEQALAWLDDNGGSAAYLRSGGLTDEELDTLCAKLTT